MKKRLPVKVDEELIEITKKVAKEQDRSLAGLVRKLLKQEVERHEKSK